MCSRVLGERRCVGVEEACVCVGDLYVRTVEGCTHRMEVVGWKKCVGWRKYVWDGGCGDQWREV